MQFFSHTLCNGLDIIAECDPSAFSTAIGFFVRAGSRDESPENSGVSHFLEHMAFKGTDMLTAADINRGFDDIGAAYNAMTSHDETTYYAAVLPEYTARAFALLAALMRPALRREDFETERQVILEEIRMYHDQPPYGIDDACRTRFFGMHPLGRSVLGTEESISRLTPQQMQAYQQRRYSARNIVVAASGCVNFQELVDLAEQHCSDLSPEENDRVQLRLEPSFGIKWHLKETATQEYLIQLAEAPPAHSPERYAARLLSAIVGDSTASRLYWEFLDPGRAELASLSYEAHEDTGVFMTFLSCAPEMATENLQRLRALYERIEADGVTPEELERIKNKLASAITIAAERPASRLFAIGSERLITGEYHSVQDDLKTIDAITLEEVNAVAKKYPLICAATDLVGPWRPAVPSD